MLWTKHVMYIEVLTGTALISITPVRHMASPQLCIDAHKGEQRHQQRLYRESCTPPGERIPWHGALALMRMLLQQG